jgi:hypothetical protein
VLAPVFIAGPIGGVAALAVGLRRALRWRSADATGPLR